MPKAASQRGVFPNWERCSKAERCLDFLAHRKKAGSMAATLACRRGKLAFPRVTLAEHREPRASHRETLELCRGRQEFRRAWRACCRAPGQDKSKSRRR